MRRGLAVAAAAVVAAGLVLGVTVAQGGPGARPLPGLPAYTAGYGSWFKINRRPTPPRPSGDAHPGTTNVYASRRIRGNR